MVQRLARLLTGVGAHRGNQLTMLRAAMFRAVQLDAARDDGSRQEQEAAMAARVADAVRNAEVAARQLDEALHKAEDVVTSLRLPEAPLAAVPGDEVLTRLRPQEAVPVVVEASGVEETSAWVLSGRQSRFDKAMEGFTTKWAREEKEAKKVKEQQKDEVVKPPKSSSSSSKH